MAAPLTLGLVRIGSVDLAIPGDLIEEVVRGPVALSRFPQAPWHVLGAFALRGKPVPTIDLATLLQSAADTQPLRPVAFAMVIRHPEGRFAVQVDEVLGVVQVTDAELTKVETRGGGTQLFSQIYTPSGHGRPAVVLELDTILAIDGVRSALMPVQVAQGAGTREVATWPYVVFRASGACFALDARVVRQVERRSETIDSSLDHPVLQGFHRIRNDDLPIVDLMGVLGLPSLGMAFGAKHLVVAEHQQRSVALSVDDIVAIEQFDPSALNPVPEDGVGRPDYYAGSVVSAKSGVVLVLDHERFLEGAAVVDQSALFAEQAAEEAQVRADLRAPTQYLVYRAGGYVLATPLVDIEAVTNLPDDYVDLREPGRPLVGLCSRLGKPVKLVDLGALLDVPLSRIHSGTSVLIVSTPRGRQGYLVESVDFLQSAVPQRLPNPDRRAHGVVPPFEQMIRARNDGRDLAACVMDLAGLAERRPVGLASRAA